MKVPPDPRPGNSKPRAQKPPQRRRFPAAGHELLAVSFAARQDDPLVILCRRVQGYVVVSIVSIIRINIMLMILL